MTFSIMQTYTAPRAIVVDRLASGELSIIARDGGAITALTLTTTEATALAEFIRPTVVVAPPPPPPLIGADPYWSTVVLQTDFEGANGSTTPFMDDTGRHLIGGMTPGWSQITTIEAISGSSSHWSWNTFSCQTPHSTDFDLSANDQPFTVDYSLRQTDIDSVYNVLSNANGPLSTGFTIRHNGRGLQFAWFDNTGVHRDVNVSSAGWIANYTHAIRVSKNPAGKIRLFIDGKLKASATPTNSTIRASGEALTINQSGAGQQSRIDRLRINKGVCRDDSDADYDPGTNPFPVP